RIVTQKVSRRSPPLPLPLPASTRPSAVRRSYTHLRTMVVVLHHPETTPCFCTHWARLPPQRRAGAGGCMSAWPLLSYPACGMPAKGNAQVRVQVPEDDEARHDGV